MELKTNTIFYLFLHLMKYCKNTIGINNIIKPMNKNIGVAMQLMILTA